MDRNPRSSWLRSARSRGALLLALLVLLGVGGYLLTSTTIRGDRDPNVGAGLSGLRERSWDAVIDTSGYIPRHVAASAEMLAPVVGSAKSARI